MHRKSSVMEEVHRQLSRGLSFDCNTALRHAAIPFNVESPAATILSEAITCVPHVLLLVAAWSHDRMLQVCKHSVLLDVAQSSSHGLVCITVSTQHTRLFAQGCCNTPVDAVR